MPKVTVIIPNYNHARFLEERIDSVLNQTYQDFEIILLDDASTDNSREIITKYSDNPKIQLIFNDRNSGSPFKQWNKGLENATGEYIWIAESDDYADRTFLKQLVEKLERHPSVGLAYCNSWIVDDSGQTLGNTESWNDSLEPQRWKSDFINNGLEECKNYLCIKNTIPNASAVVFRKSYCDRLDREIQQFKYCGDWLFWTAILLSSDVCFVRESLNYHRRHLNSCGGFFEEPKASNIDEHIAAFNFLRSKIELPQKSLTKAISFISDSWTFYFYKNFKLSQQNTLIYKKILKLSSSPQTFLYLHFGIAKVIIKNFLYLPIRKLQTK